MTTSSPTGPVTEPPVQSPTSLNLIDEALANGAIDKETAVTYKLYHLFGDDRLPEPYATVLDPQGHDGESFLRDLRVDYDGLSSEMQALVGPYLVQPFYEGSWWDYQHRATPAAAKPAFAQARFLADSPDPGVPPCTPRDPSECQVSMEWNSITTNNNMMRIWYPTTVRGLDEAEKAKREIDSYIWSELTQPMRREPKSDAGFLNNGIDELIDIAIVDRGIRSHVGDMGLGLGTCQDTPGYMVLALGSDALAHEFMHLIQFAFPVQGGGSICRDWDWIDEGVSDWASNLVFPGQQLEHPAGRDFLNRLELTLDYADDAREYGTWLFWLYLSKTYFPDTIGDIYTARAGERDSLKAVDRTIPGGFEERWREFALYAWNQDPIRHFRDWDAFQGSAEPLEPQFPTIDLTGKVDQKIQLDHLVLEPLSAWHLHFRVPDEVRSIGFYNGMAYALAEQATETGSVLSVSPDLPDSKGLHIDALLKIDGAWQEPQDWTQLPYRHLCTDAPSERVEEIVLIFSNSEFADPARKLQAQNVPTTLFASNFGCARWEGEITSTYTPENGTETVTGTDLVFERDPSQVTPVGGGYNVNYVLTSGRIDWDYDFTYESCTERGTGSGLRVVPHHTLATMNWFISGAWYRAASASIPVEVDPLITLSCPDEPDQTSAHFVVLSFPLEMAQVEDDGSTISGTYREVDLEVTWHLEAVRP